MALRHGTMKAKEEDDEHATVAPENRKKDLAWKFHINDKRGRTSKKLGYHSDFLSILLSRLESI